MRQGSIDHFINVSGIAALQRGDDVADIDTSAQHVIGVAGAGLDPGHHPPLLVPRLGRVARLGKATQNLSLVHGTAHPDIVGGGFDQAVEHNIAGEPKNVVDAVVLAPRHRLFVAAVLTPATDPNIYTEEFDWRWRSGRPCASPSLPSHTHPEEPLGAKRPPITWGLLLPGVGRRCRSRDEQ